MDGKRQTGKQAESELDESGFLWFSCTSQSAIFYSLPATNFLRNYFGTGHKRKTNKWAILNHMWGAWAEMQVGCSHGRALHWGQRPLATWQDTATVALFFGYFSLMPSQEQLRQAGQSCRKGKKILYWCYLERQEHQSSFSGAETSGFFGRVLSGEVYRPYENSSHAGCCWLSTTALRGIPEVAYGHCRDQEPWHKVRRREQSTTVPF